MIKVHSNTLNSHGQDIHPICRYALETLIYFMPDEFQEASLVDCDVVLTNAPACPPYSFDEDTFRTIDSLKKPVFILSDADGYMPDCEGQSPNRLRNFQNFVRYYPHIKGYFYREWWKGYERPDLAFPLLTYELVGYLWTRHPKDRADWTKITTKQHFLGRKWDVLMAQSLNCKSRIALFNALNGFPNCSKRDLNVSGKDIAEAFMNELLTAKLAISLEGAGIKCVSHYEVPMCSLLVTHAFGMEETYPWIDGFNCIKLPYFSKGGEGSFLEPEGRGVINSESSRRYLQDILNQPERLWEMFCACQENARKYQLGPYWKNHVGAKIKELL